MVWESMAGKASLKSSMEEHSLKKQKARKAFIKKATKKAEPNRCFPAIATIDKENVAAASYNLGSSNGPCYCAYKSSAQTRDNCFSASAGRSSVDSIVSGALTSVDLLVGGGPRSVDSLIGVRRSTDSAIASEFTEELLARIQAHMGRKEGRMPSKEKLGLDQYHGECKNVQRVKESNMYAHERMSRSKDKNVQWIKGSNVYAHERSSRSKDDKCNNVQWEEGTNVCVYHQRIYRSKDDNCKNGQWVKWANVHAHQRMCRSIDSGLYVQIRSSDMPMSMQLHVVQLTKQVLDKQQEHLSLMDTARALKQGFDGQHGYVWHCVVGASYGSYVTHSVGSSIYFSVGNLAILLFKTALCLHTSSP